MPTPSEQPRFDQPVVDGRGCATLPWMNYWLRMASGLSQDGLAEAVADLNQRVQALQNGQSLSFQLIGDQSVAVDGIPQPGHAVVLSLAGDVRSPGNTTFYGTGPTGIKGWAPMSSAIAAAAGELSKAVDATGLTTLGLADLANSGAGALLAVTRDAKGRVSGTRAATITGTANQVDVANGSAAAGVPTLSLAAAVLTSLGKADSAVQSIVPGAGIAVNNADPRNPVVSASGGGGGFVPYNVPDGQSFTVPIDQQALFTLSINLGDGSSLVLDGALVEVS